MIELDGSFGEGGGAILRQALSLSMFTGKQFKIENIRKGRPNPGLAHQHLAALEASKELCNAIVHGGSLGSTEVYFKPGEVKGGSHKIDIGTAGSITLLLQSLLLPSLFSGKKCSFIITGGTDVSWSPPFDYYRSVFLPQMKRFGEVDMNLFKRGYYPRGGGEVRVSVNSKFNKDDVLPPIFIMRQKKLLHIRGVSHSALELEQQNASENMAENARLLLRSKGHPVSITTEYSRSDSPGAGITLWAVFGDEEVDYLNPVIMGASSLADKSLKFEGLGMKAAEELIETISSATPIDEHLVDQLVPYLALTGGAIKAKCITKHVLSNIYVAEKFLDVKFEVSENEIRCEKSKD